jgi:Holliday junction resolvasome RuvABC endonuclease subunit
MDQHSDTADKIQLLKANVERLLRSFQAVQRENEILKQQMDAVRKGSAEKTKKIEALEQQLDMQKTAHSIANIAQLEEGSGDKTEVRKRINDLIKEVDNCIALLNE